MIRILGIMAGSSRDGIDMAICYIQSLSKGYTWGIEATNHIPLSEEWRKKLDDSSTWSASELLQYDAEFGNWIGRHAKHFIDGHDEKVSLIAVHGQTLFHEPSKRFTFQLGHGAHIAAQTSIDTITDFRSADIAHGGQGAPFAPVVDRMLFPEHPAYLNLGGIANAHIAIMPSKAWDIGPCNQVLNYLAEHLGLTYDDEGKIASGGTVDNLLLASLIYHFPPNQGSAKGMSNLSITQTWIKDLNDSSLSLPDKLATAVEAIATSICDHLKDATSESLRVFVTGGGAFNSFLMLRLNSIGEKMNLHFFAPDHQIIQYKECLLMCCLGYLTYHKRNFGIAELTGAGAESIGGAYFAGKHE